MATQQHWFRAAHTEALESLKFLSGAEPGTVSIYSVAFLILFAAKVWGVLAWPWWAVFVPLIASGPIHLVWWLAQLLVELCTGIIRRPLNALLQRRER